MSSLLSEIHFWTTQEDVIVDHSYYGAFKYYSKKDCYHPSSKKMYCEQRSILWNPINKRQNKLKDRLKELEDNLIQNKIISYLWKENSLQLLLSTGLIVFLKISEQTGDVVNISFDKQLSAKLQVNIICDGIILGAQVVCICNDGHVLGYGASWKDGWLLEGGPRRRIHSHGEWLVVWGRPGSEHPQPWSPLTRDYQRANLHLYWLGSRGPELLAYRSTDGEPFIIIVSKVFEQTIITVEQKVTQRGAVSVEVSSLELSLNTLRTVAITAVPLQTQVSCCELSSNEAYLLICCIDSTLALLDRNRGSTRTIKASFIPTLCTWQKSSAIAAICNEKGQFQYYDVALNCVKTQITSEDDTPSALLDLTGYFHSQVSVASINWGNNHLLIALEQGPIVCVTHTPNSFTFTSLAKKYISRCEMKKAIALLLSWNFNEDSFFILQKLVCYLLKKPMTEEVAQQLQDALGCYHASANPLSTELRSQYGNQVFSLTRRYFHQLIRAEMYETAFLLAVDMGHHDLFMDLYYIAVKIGETEMAAAARAQASALVSRCSSAASHCSDTSCSECSLPCGTNNSEKVFKNDQIDNTKISSSDSTSDNLISTNFNQPEILRTHNLPSSGGHEYPKLNPPRGNYVKPPQVPPTFNKQSSTIVPPLPLSCLSPNLMYSKLGIPFLGSTNVQHNRGSFYTTHLENPFPTSNQKQTLPNLTSQINVAENSQLNFESSLNTYLEDNNLMSFDSDSMSKKYTCEGTQATKFGESTQSVNFGEDNVLSSFVESIPSVTFGDSTTDFTNSSYNERKISSANFPTTPSNMSWLTQSKLDTSFKDKGNSMHNFHRSSFVPPLPVLNNIIPPSNFPFQSTTYTQSATSTINSLLSPFTSTMSLNSSNSSVPVPFIPSRKPQSKVKFSDTVTAFIVPEVKRPLRPPPPSHVTDPQKELADSLPLCHPNEDYLKDFAPVKQDDNCEENRNPPKIKVVHFGVV